MDKLKTTSRRLQWVTLAFMLLTPCAFALNMATESWAEMLKLPQGIPLDPSRIEGMALLAILLLAAITPAFHLLAFFFLYKLLGLYGEGIVFRPENVATIRKIGWSIALIDVAGMIQTLVTGPVLTLLEISPRHLSVRLEVGFLVIGLFIVLVSYVMDMGRDLKEKDNLVI